MKIFCKTADAALELVSMCNNSTMAIDYLFHNLTTANMEAYDFGIKALRFICDYLNKKKQRAKTDNV